MKLSQLSQNSPGRGRVKVAITLKTTLLPLLLPLGEERRRVLEQGAGEEI